MNYVFYYRCDGHQVIEVADIKRIARIVGESDFNECTGFKVWRCCDDGRRMEQLVIVNMMKESCVYLQNHYGDFVESADYEEH